MGRQTFEREQQADGAELSRDLRMRAQALKARITTFLAWTRLVSSREDCSGIFSFVVPLFLPCLTKISDRYKVLELNIVLLGPEML